MNLKELTLKAIDDIEVFRQPNISEWVQNIDPVLEASGQCNINYVHVASLYIGEDDGEPTLYISTEYSVRGCMACNDMTIPMRIIMSDDPVAAATEHKRASDIHDLEYDIIVTEKALSIKKERLNGLLLSQR